MYQVVERLLLRAVFAVILVASLASAVLADNSTGKSVTLETLRAVFEGDDVDATLTLLKSIDCRDSANLYQFLVDVWRGEDAAYHGLTPMIVDDERVRLNVARVLLTAASLTKSDSLIDRQSARDYVSRVLREHADPPKRDRLNPVVVEAVGVLQQLGEEVDIAAMVEVARTENMRTLFPTVFMLVIMCDPIAERALDNLEHEVIRARSKTLIPEIRTGLRKQMEESGACPARN